MLYKSYKSSFLTFLNCIQGDHATMHMKELPMFTYNLWIDCLHPDKSCQLFCPVINIAMSNNLNTLMCTLHIFSSNKARFIHTSTVTILHSCSGKKMCARLACILFLYKNQYF